MALLPIGVMLAQTDSTRTVKDTKRELRRQRVAKRNLHYNILGGPSYTPDFGFLVGGSALMTFRRTHVHRVDIQRRAQPHDKAATLLQR